MIGVPSAFAETPPDTSRRLFPIPRISAARDTSKKAAGESVSHRVSKRVFFMGRLLDQCIEKGSGDRAARITE
jgi:hypothetical protein